MRQKLRGLLFCSFCTCSVNRSDELGGQYIDPDYEHLTVDSSDYAEYETKPLLQQYEHYTQPASDFITLTPSSVVDYDNAPANSHITYTQLQPL